MKLLVFVLALLSFPFSIFPSTIYCIDKDLTCNTRKNINVDLPVIKVLCLSFSQQYQEQSGKIYIESLPEDGMAIHIDNKFTGKYTPAAVENIPFGKHVVRLTHPLYRSQEESVEVGELAIKLKFSMVAAYAEISINTTNDAIIRIDGKLTGSTSWKGKLAEGLHLIKVEKDGFFSREQQITVMRGRDMHVDLMLTVKTGSLEITTDPPGVMITLDGKMYGLTPKTIKDLPLGIYNLSLDKPEHTGIIKRVTISDSELQQLEFTLASGKEITITSSVESTLVYID
ncbi:MAG TPA: hypothetical protein DG754_11520, partial [Bacteroidales bacterium]|nr:hypothetical protein [Bacteroidales bacterium]